MIPVFGSPEAPKGPGASAASPTPHGAPQTEPLVHVEGLKTYFRTFNGLVKAVDDVTFDIFPGEVLAIVGESGSGKSVCVRSLMGLNSSRNAEISGRADFDGTDLLALQQEEWKQIRGRRIGMIFQEPMSSFDPLYTVGEQAVEAYLAHFGGEVRTAEARRRIIEMFRRVRIPEAERRFDDYPHQLSGGMLQRIMIAVVLALDPEVLIADEPTTALDVTIQAQILRLMRDLQERTGTSIVFITHDLGVVSQIADRVIVMYAGKIVEAADVHTLLADPQHPYTKGLLRSRVKPEFKGSALPSIPGVVPRPFEFPAGCRFNPRCEFAFDRCRVAEPPLFAIPHGRESVPPDGGDAPATEPVSSGPTSATGDRAPQEQSPAPGEGRTSTTAGVGRPGIVEHVSACWLHDQGAGHMEGEA